MKVFVWGRRSSLFAVLLAVCGACVSSGREGSVPVAQGPEYRYWPHEPSDISPDPGVRFGVLKNGMRYAIKKNRQPAGAVSLRLRVGAGSVQEKAEQKGLAHFLEHMAFNGSKNVPEGEFVKLLQRKGLAFGAHTNAYTSTHETVYSLELPKNDSDLIDTGLMLFREVGDRLSLDEKAIEREKGVVLSELRTRNTPEYRAYQARWRLNYEGQHVADRLPIGTAETIQNASKALLEEYYRRNYRPERALLVMTGDIDLDDVERRLKAKFDDWSGVGPDHADPDMGTPKKRGLVAVSHIEANLPERTTVSWFQPSKLQINNKATREAEAQGSLAMAIVNRRLQRIARASNPPFVSASVWDGDFRGVASALTFSCESRPGRWHQALAATEQELRRAAIHGFSDAEVARELKEWDAGYADQAATADTRETGQLADGLTSAFDDRSVFSHPTDDYAIFKSYRGRLTPHSAQLALQSLAKGEGPVLLLSSGTPVEGGDLAIADAFRKSQALAVVAQTSAVAKEFPYRELGADGRIRLRSTNNEFAMELVEFGNGVKLNVKATDFEKDTIIVNVRIAGGMIHLPHQKVGLYWALPFGFMEGGVRKLTPDELDESLTGRIASAGLDIEDDAFVLEGRTNRADLLIQLQLLAAYISDAAYRTEGLERLQAAAESYIKQFSSSPDRVLSRELPALLRSGDTRWKFPSLAELSSIKIRDIKSVMEPLLRSGAIEISIVGDVDIEDTIAGVAKTFGALPQRNADTVEPKDARSVKFPKSARNIRFVHEGSGDQAAAYAVWGAPDFYSDVRRSRALTLLREMIEVRLTDEFREAQGATYSPSAGSSFSTVFAGFGFLSARAATRPDLVDGFYSTLDKVVVELRNGAFSEDLIDRARTPLVKSLEQAQSTNGYWSGLVSQAQTESRSLATYRTLLSDYKSLTKAELVAVAREFLSIEHQIEVRVLPKRR